MLTFVLRHIATKCHNWKKTSAFILSIFYIQIRQTTNTLIFREMLVADGNAAIFTLTKLLLPVTLLTLWKFIYETCTRLFLIYIFIKQWTRDKLKKHDPSLSTKIKCPADKCYHEAAKSRHTSPCAPRACKNRINT